MNVVALFAAVVQEKKGHVFESETDTETIAKLVHHLYDLHKELSFRELVEKTIQQLVRRHRAVAAAVKRRRHVSFYQLSFLILRSFFWNSQLKWQ